MIPQLRLVDSAAIQRGGVIVQAALVGFAP
jgi:hypothetical protein